MQQFESLFSPWIAHWRLAQQDQGAHSRDRCWNPRLVFWSFLWQVGQAGASCREAIRQAQALCLASGRLPPPDTTSPYCQARAVLPLERLEEIHEGLVTEAEATSPRDPNGDLILGSDGNFYGTTYYGGSGGFGTVFRITPSGAPPFRSCIIEWTHRFLCCPTEAIACGARYGGYRK